MRESGKIPEQSEEERNQPVALTLEQARSNLQEAEETIGRVDNLLNEGIIYPRNDAELAAVVGISMAQLGKVREYIITGRVSLDLGNCPNCHGWGRWDDCECGECHGTGNLPD